MLRAHSSGGALEDTVFVQDGHEVIEIETAGSYLEYRFRTTEGIRL